MQSRSRLLRHPLHPMLIVVPSTLFPLLVVLDVLYLWLGDDAFWTVGPWIALAGAVSTLAAMIPGIVDLAHIPDETRAHRTAFIHFVVGTLTLVAYAGAAWLRWGAGTERFGYATAIDVAGVLLVTLQGWLGGELVYKHHIGVLTPAEGADPVALTGKRDRSERTPASRDRASRPGP